MGEDRARTREMQRDQERSEEGGGGFRAGILAGSCAETVRIKGQL